MVLRDVWLRLTSIRMRRRTRQIRMSRFRDGSGFWLPPQPTCQVWIVHDWNPCPADPIHPDCYSERSRRTRSRDPRASDPNWLGDEKKTLLWNLRGTGAAVPEGVGSFKPEVEEGVAPRRGGAGARGVEQQSRWEREGEIDLQNDDNMITGQP